MAGLGHLALLLAFVLSSCAIVADLLGNWRSSARLIWSGRVATCLSFGCLSIAVITLAIALGGSDLDGHPQSNYFQFVHLGRLPHTS